MKKSLLFVTSVSVLYACKGPADTEHTSGMPDAAMAVVDESEKSVVDFHNVFTQTDAEKILGESASLSDSSTSIEADTTIYKSTYTAKAADNKSGKTGNIYFMYEQYKEASTAHDLLAYYKTANEKNGAKSVTGIGDEAWFHSDGNFYFLMARKNNKMIRMKVNKVTANTSLDAFNTVAKQIVETM